MADLLEGMSTLWKVENNTSGTNSQKKIKCRDCHKEFVHPRNLLQHTRVQHEGVRFYCAHCDQSYTRQYNLTNHKLRSHPEKLTAEEKEYIRRHPGLSAGTQQAAASDGRKNSFYFQQQIAARRLAQNAQRRKQRFIAAQRLDETQAPSSSANTMVTTVAKEGYGKAPSTLASAMHRYTPIQPKRSEHSVTHLNNHSDRFYIGGGGGRPRPGGPGGMTMIRDPRRPPIVIQPPPQYAVNNRAFGHYATTSTAPGGSGGGARATAVVKQGYDVVTQLDRHRQQQTGPQTSYLLPTRPTMINRPIHPSAQELAVESRQQPVSGGGTNSAPSLSCPKCPFVSQHRQGLIIHIDRHVKPRDIGLGTGQAVGSVVPPSAALSSKQRCRFCDYTNKSDALVGRHVGVHFPSAAPSTNADGVMPEGLPLGCIEIECKFCGKLYRNRNDLECHESLHNGTWE